MNIRPERVKAATRHPVLRASARLLAMLACAGLGACALVPGDKAYGLRDQQSAVKLPVRQEPVAEPAPQNVSIKPITAELIIEQMKQAAVERPTATSPNMGGRAGAGPMPAMPDYKVGPGMCSPSSCGITRS